MAGTVVPGVTGTGSFRGGEPPVCAEVGTVVPTTVRVVVSCIGAVVMVVFVVRSRRWLWPALLLLLSSWWYAAPATDVPEDLIVNASDFVLFLELLFANLFL